ncbi:MAG TPA: hypothetical protein P5555_19625 [Candidatus Paceibacterota bacterium]|nr:hypothetical protein [Verrucomicrobiota bacterium]HRZ47396.1 hypothetical protein [Candidatus Paceibacterota bacterium]HRZ92870.1 hypothetical protein [Candidatus Paceibacterota bacterium]
MKRNNVMGSIVGMLAIAMLVGVTGARAQLFLEVGDHSLLPNTANQTISLYLQNPTDSPIAISGLDISIQVADSGPASEGGEGYIDGPNITGLDIITGTLFGAVANTGNNVWLSDTDPENVPIPPQFAFGNTAAAASPYYFSFQPTTIENPPVLLAIVTIDTTGFTSSASWDLYLKDPSPANGWTTYITGAAQTDLVLMNIVDGTIAVPEPQAGLVLASLLLLGRIGWLRFGTQKAGK